MFFSRLALFSAVFAIAESAKLTNTAESFNGVTAGKPLTITWAEASGPVTLLLKAGPSTNLRTVSTLASGQTGNSFVWTPETTLPSDTYAIQINDASGINYSMQFPIKSSSMQSSAPVSPSAPPASSSPVASSSNYPSSAPISTGYSSSPSSFASSYSSNMTSTMSNSARLTSTYVSAMPTGHANYTSTRAPAATTSAPETIPSDTNTATAVTSPAALLMLVLAAIVMMQ
ncbi:hypothetical protein Golomagni_02978 [Golovinomyces magnicellulatus]|nr:hypothetical protein Golomagni_02978 [Golovinomyces magnicellulatus]